MYYTLVVNTGGLWHAEFGDFDRQVVREERDAAVESGYRSKEVKVIATEPEQEAIQHKIDILNRP